MKLITTEKIIRHQNKLWQTRNSSNPAFQPQGQEKFTYENYNKLCEQAERFNKLKWVMLEELRNELGLLRDAIKQGKPALPCVDALIEELGVKL